MITGTDILTYLGATDTLIGVGGLAQECANTAIALVGAYIGECEVPESILFRAELLVGAEMFSQRNAPSGILALESESGMEGMRVARNPMAGAYPLLAPFVGFGIA